MTSTRLIMADVISGVLASLVLVTVGPALGSCASSYKACTSSCNGSNQCVHNCINVYASCNAQQGINLGPPKNQPTRNFHQKATMGWPPAKPFGR